MEVLPLLPASPEDAKPLLPPILTSTLVNLQQEPCHVAVIEAPHRLALATVRKRTDPCSAADINWKVDGVAPIKELMDVQAQDGPFDRSLRRQRRDRAAAGAVDYLHRRAGEDLLDRLSLVTRPFARALDLSSGPGAMAPLLRARGLAVVSADSGARFAAGRVSVQCDEDRLPFADQSFDLVVSVGALDSVNDLPGALVLIRRILKPDGLFLGAFVGAGSLPRLREAMRAADEAEGGGVSPHIHPQIDLRTAGDLLGRAGFALPVVDADTVTVRYPGLPALVDDLRSMGATNLLNQRARRPIRRAGLAAAQACFAAAAEADGKTAERFEIIHLSGWAPAASQPKPARRGSANASLAQALARKD